LLLNYPIKDRDNDSFRTFLSEQVRNSLNYASNRVADECEEQFYYITTLMCVHRCNFLITFIKIGSYPRNVDYLKQFVDIANNNSGFDEKIAEIRILLENHKYSSMHEALMFVCANMFNPVLAKQGSVLKNFTRAMGDGEGSVLSNGSAINDATFEALMRKETYEDTYTKMTFTKPI
jgi:hypothetical protein